MKDRLLKSRPFLAQPPKVKEPEENTERRNSADGDLVPTRPEKPKSMYQRKDIMPHGTELARKQERERRYGAPHFESPRTQVKDLVDADQKRKLLGRNYRKMRCGLCEQDYPVECLPRRVTRARIFKLRASWIKHTEDPELLGHAGHLVSTLRILMFFTVFRFLRS